MQDQPLVGLRQRFQLVHNFLNRFIAHSPILDPFGTISGMIAFWSYRINIRFALDMHCSAMCFHGDAWVHDHICYWRAGDLLCGPALWFRFLTISGCVPSHAPLLFLAALQHVLTAATAAIWKWSEWQDFHLRPPGP